MSGNNCILVTGASGRTGRAVISALSKKGAYVRAFIRRADVVDDIKLLGAAEILLGDLFETESLVFTRASMTVAKTPKAMAAPVCTVTTTPRMIASKIAVCKTSVLEKATAAAKDRWLNSCTSKMVKITCVRAAIFTHIQKLTGKPAKPLPVVLV